MPLENFKKLWIHRYHKLNYIIRESLLGYYDAVGFWFLKKMKKKMLVALIRTEHFGDIVAAEPIASQVRKLHPHAHLIWFVKPTFSELVNRHPAIDEVWLQSSVLRRIKLCQSGVFDKVYNMEFWQSNFDTVTGKVHQNPTATQQDITVYNYFDKGNLLKIFQIAAGLPVEDTIPPRVFITEHEVQKIDSLSLPQKMIVLHCNSNFSPKDWTVQNWQKLIYWLIERGFWVVEIGLKSQNTIHHAQYLNLCGQLSIIETAEVIRRARFFIGIDSGPAHLANAVGTFGILLIGRLNDFVNQMPYSGNYQSGKNALIIRQGDRTCADIEYDVVMQQIEGVI